MIYGVSFDGKHCYADYGLLLAEKDIDAPEVQTNTKTVTGRDGLLDLSTALDGLVHYENREMTLTFITGEKISGKNWADMLSTISNAIHGQRCKIVFDDDPNYYYSGRCTIKKHSLSNGKQTIEIEADCDPYKYKTDSTTVTASLTSTSKTITLSNSRKPVVPSITVTAQTTLTFDDSTYTVNAGTHKIPGIRLVSGSNKLTAKTVSGTGTITITYQEGSL